MIAAVLLAFVPRLPSADASNGFGLSNGSVRITSGTNRRLRLFAVTQIAASFVLLAGAGMLLTTLFALQAAPHRLRHAQRAGAAVPVMSYGRTPDQVVGFYKEAMRRITELPGVERVAVGTVVPWRDAGRLRSGLPVLGGGVRQSGRRRGSARAVPHRLAGILRGARRPDHGRPRFQRGGPPRRRAGRDREPEPGAADVPDAGRGEPPPDVDRSRHAVHRREPGARGGSSASPPTWTTRTSCPGRRSASITRSSRRIGGGRLFVHARTDPYALVPPITRIIRELSADQPVEQAATLEDVRAEVLAPDRLNALVFGGFAGVALTIAVVGVAGVLAFSVSARTREFGIRLAIGSAPRHLLTRVLGEGASIAGAGIVAGRGRRASRSHGSSVGYIQDVRIPGAAADRRSRDDSRRRRDPGVADAGRARLARRRHPGVAFRVAPRRAIASTRRSSAADDAASALSPAHPAFIRPNRANFTGTSLAVYRHASRLGRLSMRALMCVLGVAATLAVAPVASAQEPRAALQGFGGLQLGSLTTADTTFGGVLTTHLTQNIQVLGEAGRVSNILPPMTQTLIGLSPIGFSVSAWYGQGGIRFSAGQSAIRPYAEVSAGVARLQSNLGSLGNARADAIANVALRFLDRTDPMATVGGGITLEGGPFVADVGYRYRRIFSDDWVNVLALGDTLHTSEVRLGIGVRF